MAQSAPMAIALPPSMQADYLALRREGWIAVARALTGPVLLVLACSILAAIPLYRDLDWLTLASAVLALTGSQALTRNRLMRALSQARFGWCGALPIGAHAIQGALLVLAAAWLFTAVVLGSLLLAGAALAAPHPEVRGFGLLALDGGLVVGTFAAVVQVLRPGAAARSRHADGIREPLLALRWLSDPRLPHLLDWQRRRALQRWRGGGNFALVGVVLAGVPMGAAVFDVAGLVLLTLSLTWLMVVMHACMAATAEACRLLGATPVAGVCVRRAALRYPLLAITVATIWAVIGTLILRGSFMAMVGWAVCAVAAASWPLFQIVKTVPPGRST